MIWEWLLKHPGYLAIIIAIAFFDLICYAYLIYDYLKRKLRASRLGCALLTL
jgi:hypothetical protein